VLKFFYSGQPNPIKIALFLEEAEIEYEAIPIDVRKGDQHKEDFIALNPNAKVPVIVDGDSCIFDSNAILIYLADKYQLFLPDKTTANTGSLLSWMMFVASGVGPYSGQAVHFQHFAPDKLPYAIKRYRFEALRHYGILDQRLGTMQYVLGDTYTIVDMAVWGWARMIPFILGEDAFLKLPNLQRLVAEITVRPAAKRAESLKDKHRFKTDMDEDAKRNMFPSNYQVE
tara:strand:- start:973 stop:1656 length:684 start_codon:yes stop_codon:yes gene_type:complete